MNKKLSLFFIFIGLLGVNFNASAQNYKEHSNEVPYILGNGLQHEEIKSCGDFKVISNNYLKEYDFKQTSWIVGELNKEYKIQLINNCDQNIMAILSVDGLNTLNGQRANFNSPGYLLGPKEKIIINGWQKSKNKIASFYFTYPENSYANKSNNNFNLGIIGVAFFNEKNNRKFKEKSLESVPSNKINNLRKSDEQAVGTGWGREQNNPIDFVNFNKEENPFYIKNVRYDSYKNLVSMGIIKNDEPKSFSELEFNYAKEYK